MSGKASHWATFGVRLYYFLGFSYYVYQWFLYAGGVGLIAAAFAYALGSPALWLIVAVIASILSLIFGLTIFFLSVRKRYKSANPGLKILSSRTVYRILPSDTYIYDRELEVIAAFDGVDHFTHSFGWTGEGQVAASAGGGGRAELAIDNKSTRQKLRVYFDRPRRKRDQFKVAYRLEMQDAGKKARNFVRTTINEKTRLLDLEIEFPAEQCPDTYKLAIYMSDIAEIPVFEEVLPINRQDHKVKWTVHKPRFDYNYCVSW